MTLAEAGLRNPEPDTVTSQLFRFVLSATAAVVSTGVLLVANVNEELAPPARTPRTRTVSVSTRS